jgi:hypothetical protein
MKATKLEAEDRPPWVPVVYTGSTGVAERMRECIYASLAASGALAAAG